MEKIVKLSDFQKEAKRRERKEWFGNKIKSVAEWTNNNKEVILVVVPAAVATVSGGAKIVKSISRNSALRQEQRMKERFVYDRSLGAYLELKKPLKDVQWKAILDRKEKGERLSTILKDMNLLK